MCIVKHLLSVPAHQIHLELLLWVILSPISPSRITLSNGGVYNNILVAIHPYVHPDQCVQLLKNITEAFQHTSIQLNLGTHGKVSFGSVNILIPSSWTPSNCEALQHQNVTWATNFDFYHSADFKVSSNQFDGANLPLTNQYKGCENESDFIGVPVEFFQNANFDSETRARFLLAEWTKFRYGVFEEKALFPNSPSQSSCYSVFGLDFFTPCSSSRSLSDFTRDDAVGCTSLRSKNWDRTMNGELTDQFLLLKPQLAKMSPICAKEFQFGVSATKHNRLCERRSVDEVIFAHRDFSEHQSTTETFFPSRKQRPASGRRSFQISLLKRNEDRGQGYAFILEDSASLREFERLKYVKQAIAMVLQLLQPDTNVAVLRFEGVKYTHSVTKIVTDWDKIKVLSKIPEVGTYPLSESPSARGWGRSSQARFTNPNRKKESVLSMVDFLDGRSDQWHLVLITASPPGDLIEALPRLGNSSNWISVVTFDESSDWLKFNGIPNVNKVSFLPSCSQASTECYGKPTSLFVNLFTESIIGKGSTAQPFTHHVLDFTFVGGSEATFTISGDNFVTDLENFRLFLPFSKPESVPTLYSPSRRFCRYSKLLNYDRVVQFDTSQETGCPYEIGSWTVQVTGDVSTMYTLMGIGTTSPNSGSNLLLKLSFGKALVNEIFPTFMSLPVYVVVSTENEQPVIIAEVAMNMFDGNRSTSMILRDNGMDPDLVANDGVYSTFVTNFSLSPAFHTGHVTVKTTKGRAKVISGIRLVKVGTLRDADLSSSCCSDFIPVNTLQDVGTSCYSIIFPSFRTGEKLEPEIDYSPPSRVQSRLTIVDSTLQREVTFEFVSPGGDHQRGTVTHYDICCTNSPNGPLDDRRCIHLVDEYSTCQPVSPGATQRCVLPKSALSSAFLNDSTAVAYSTLFCSLRGVDRAGNVGPLSYHMVEIKLEPERNTENTDTVACSGFSDGCLRLDVFWALIGCIAGLLLILFMVLVCWCCVSRQEGKMRKGKKNLTKKSTDNWVDAFPRNSLNNVYINRAYIQDANGQLKLIASDGVLYPIDETTLGTANANTVNFQVDAVSGESDQQQNRHVSWDQPREEIPMTATNLYASASKEQPPTALKTFPGMAHSTVSSHSRGGDGSDKPPGLSAVHLEIQRSEQAIGSMSSVGTEERDGPVYASVFRHGRKVIPKPAEDNGYRQRDFRFQRVVPPVTAIKVHDATDRDSQDELTIKIFADNATVATSVSRNSPPEYLSQSVSPVIPPKLDHFPSSESEVYSDLSQIVKSPARPLVHRSLVSKQKPRPTSSPVQVFTPNKETFEVKVQLEHHRSMEIPKNLRSFSPPPPPPPRRQQTRYDHSPSPTDELPPSSPVTATADRYIDDDDSDTWENYDSDGDATLRIRCKPGASYA